ncbi:MAG: hypothetical protein QME51_05490, partial [Planctomycetota bacterium]|nr:hypothetical protein [Planctomycetota bacterium]
EEHTINDTPDKIDAEKINNIINLVYNTVLVIANSGQSFPAPREVDVPFPGQGKGHHSPR